MNSCDTAGAMMLEGGGGLADSTSAGEFEWETCGAFTCEIM